MAVSNTIAKYHVYGPAEMQVGTGTTKALQSLGISQDGVEITITPNYQPIYSDAGGPSVPVDHLYMGSTVMVRATLVDWIEERLRKLRAFALNGLSATDGTEVIAGTLVGKNGTAANSNYLPLSIPTGITDSEDPWYFPTMLAMEPQQFKLSTQQMVTRVGFFCFAYVPPGSLTRGSLVTYQRSIPA